jgi:hypothetical protein
MVHVGVVLNRAAERNDSTYYSNAKTVSAPRA